MTFQKLNLQTIRRIHKFIYSSINSLNMKLTIQIINQKRMNFINSFDYDLNGYFDRNYILNEMKELLEFHNFCWLSRHALNDDSYQFYCKNNGKQCFNIIFTSQPNHQNLFALTYMSSNHLSLNCQKKNQQKLHLQTKCLIKLRREEIKRFVEQNELLGVQSGDILLTYSKKWSDSNDIFFKEYLVDGKARMDVKKNWDNILGNITRKLKNGVEKGLKQQQFEIFQMTNVKNKNILKNLKNKNRSQRIQGIRKKKKNSCDEVIGSNLLCSKRYVDSEMHIDHNYSIRKEFKKCQLQNTNLFISHENPKINFFDDTTSNYSPSMNENYYDNQNLKQLFQNSPLVSTYRLPLIN